MVARNLSDLPDVLTVEEAAGVLRIAASTLYAAVKRGEVPSNRLGRRILIHKEALVRSLSGTAITGGCMTPSLSSGR